MSKTVILDSEAFEDLNVRFNAVHMYIDTATDYARNADSIFVDAGSCNALKNKMTRGIDNIINTSQMINERFNAVDNQAANSASDITAPTVNNGSSGAPSINGSGGGNGSSSVSTSSTDNGTNNSTFSGENVAYSSAVQRYIQEHLDWLLSINDNNKYQLGISETDWCDSYVDYIIRNSGMKSAGRYNSQSTEEMENYCLRHGYDLGNGFNWDTFNNANDAHVSNDGYIPHTGDLVYVDWANSDSIATDHVGLIYIEPGTNEIYVIEGNATYEKISRMRKLDDFVKGARHVSFGDMGTYQNL